MSKYHNIRTEVDGIKFASKKEAKRYQELKFMERAKVILNLRLQPAYEFQINGADLRYSSGRKVRYVADFTYQEMPSAEWIVEDVKGIQTPVFKLKAALMKAVHGITVRIT